MLVIDMLHLFITFVRLIKNSSLMQKIRTNVSVEGQHRAILCS